MGPPGERSRGPAACRRALGRGPETASRLAGRRGATGGQRRRMGAAPLSPLHSRAPGGVRRPVPRQLPGGPLPPCSPRCGAAPPLHRAPAVRAPVPLVIMFASTPAAFSVDSMPSSTRASAAVDTPQVTLWSFCSSGGRKCIASRPTCGARDSGGGGAGRAGGRALATRARGPWWRYRHLRAKRSKGRCAEARATPRPSPRASTSACPRQRPRSHRAGRPAARTSASAA
jgi:hypothetical protein